MEEKELKETILEYVETHNSMSLATEGDGLPHAATLFYVNIGFQLYFVSSPSSRHGENIARNESVSATISEDYSGWSDIKGIQMEGRVEKVGGIMENGRIVKAYVKKFPDVADFFLSPKKLGQAIANKVAKVRFYKFVPGKIRFINNALDFGHREELILS